MTARLFAGAVIAGILLAACSSTTGATSTTSTGLPGSTSTSTSTSTTIPVPGNDPCVVGRWVSTVGSLPEQVNGATVTLTGGGGTLIVYERNGSYSADFSRTRPYVRRATGSPVVSLSVSGATAGTFTALAAQLSLSDTRTTLEVRLRVNGKLISTVHPSSTTSSGYTCKPGHLTLTSGSFSTDYVTAPR